MTAPTIMTPTLLSLFIVIVAIARFVGAIAAATVAAATVAGFIGTVAAAVGATRNVAGISCGLIRSHPGVHCIGVGGTVNVSCHAVAATPSAAVAGLSRAAHATVAAPAGRHGFGRIDTGRCKRSRIVGGAIPINAALIARLSGVGLCSRKPTHLS